MNEAHAVRLVNVEPPRHAVNRVLDQVDTIRVELRVSASEDVGNGHLGKLESFLSMVGHFGGHEAVE